MNNKLIKYNAVFGILAFACFWATMSFAQDIDLIVNKTLDIVELEIQPKEAEPIPAQQNALIDSIEFTDEKVVNIFKYMALKTGAVIKVDPLIEDRISVYLDNVELEDAIQIVADQAKLIFEKAKNENGIIYDVIREELYEQKFGRKFNRTVNSQIVMLKQAKAMSIVSVVLKSLSTKGKIIVNEKFNSLVVIDLSEKLNDVLVMVRKLDVKLKTEILELKNVEYQNIELKLKAMITQNVGQLQFDQRSNSVIITDTDEKISKVSAYIDQFNKEDYEIVLTKKVIQITLSDEQQDGVDWDAIVSDFNKLKTHRYNSSDEGGDGLFLSLGSLNREDFNVLLDALDTVGVINEVLEQDVVVSNGKSTDVLLDNGNLWKSDQINKARRALKDEDIYQLNVDVQVQDNKEIMVYVDPVIFNKDEKIPGVLALANRVAEKTGVTLTSGSTVIVGSIFFDKLVESNWKIPLLGDLPLLGFAFRNEGQVVRKTEVIVFLTPVIRNKND